MMPETPKSSFMTPNPKPNNVFYIWYTELCRRLNSNSAAIIRPSNPKCNTVLDFVADRLKFDDWSPLLNALRHDTSLHVINIRSRMSNCQFLHEVDTENKARRMKRKYGALWTDFILNSLVKALSFSIKKTQVLTCLELDGLPMFSNYLDGLLKALMENRTLKNFSLTNCSIQDAGCRSVCLCLQLLPNVEWLNLSRCDLTSVSGMYIAKLIKFQQLNRYTTSWHKSLRYSEPDSEKMCGIRRITLNANLKLGDEGLSYILNELEDDLWIEAFDVQKCGITEEISNKILDILQYNRSLRIADFRQNEDLHPCTLEKILEILREKEIYNDYDNKFQWCNSVMSLATATLPSSSRSRVNSTYTRNKTAISPPKRLNNEIIKRSKTPINIDRKCVNYIRHDNSQNILQKKKLIEVKIINTNNSDSTEIDDCGDTKKKEITTYSRAPKTKISKSPKPNNINHTNITNSIVKTFGKLQLSKYSKDAPKNTPELRNKERSEESERKNYSEERTAGCMFENFIQGVAEEPSEEAETENLMGTYDTRNEECTLEKNDLSDSQVSLYDFMLDLKMENEISIEITEEPPNDPKKIVTKQRCIGRKNRIK